MKFTIAEKLKALRIINNLSQIEVAEGLDVSQAYIAMLENGQKGPTDQMLIRMTSYFDVKKWTITSGMRKCPCCRHAFATGHVNNY